MSNKQLLCALINTSRSAYIREINSARQDLENGFITLDGFKTVCNNAKRTSEEYIKNMNASYEKIRKTKKCAHGVESSMCGICNGGITDID